MTLSQRTTPAGCPTSVSELARPDLDLTRPHPGELPAPVYLLVIGAALVTLSLALVIPQLLLDSEGIVAGPGSMLALAAFVAVTIIAAAFARSQVSIIARIAVALPLAHLVMMAVAATVWVTFAAHFPSARLLVPLVNAIPLGVVVAVVLALTFGAALVVARRRRREVAHVAVTIALVQLLVLGQWMPLASYASLDSFGIASTWRDPEVQFGSLAQTAQLALFVLAPPLVIAIGYALIATRRPHALPPLRTLLLATILVAIVAGCRTRVHASGTELEIYLNFLPWLIAVAFVAVVAIAVLCGGSLIAALRHRRRARQLAGTIVGTRAEPIAVVSIRSWLRGPELVVTGFELATREGAVPVPPGAILAAPLPLVTTALRTGESMAVLHGGDAVALGGFDAPADGSPFRRSLAPTAGSAVIVAPDPLPSTDGFAQVALAAWRPCVAYLLIFLAAALPALAGLAT